MLVNVGPILIAIFAGLINNDASTKVTCTPAASTTGGNTVVTCDGEVPPLLVIPGGVLCLAGVALARTSPRRSRTPRVTPPAR